MLTTLQSHHCQSHVRNSNFGSISDSAIWRQFRRRSSVDRLGDVERKEVAISSLSSADLSPLLASVATCVDEFNITRLPNAKLCGD
jgi:hypothetical protein